MGFFFSANPTASPNFLVSIVMFGWIPVVLYLFSRFPARRAIVISFVTAWLFLPEVAMKLPGLPDYTKMTATCYGILIATFIFDAERFRTFKYGWVDVPMLLWCCCPLASSLTNDLGLYDGLSGSLNQVVVWGIPYFLGRIYLADLAGLRQLAVGIFVGGLIYIPLCLFEVRFSPQLHRIFYGGFAHGDFSQTIRMGGYRPSVFMVHGLAVGAFMMAATLIGIWLWQTQTIKQFWNVPMPWLVGALLVTFVLVKSTGAYALLAAGVLILFIGKQFRTALPVFVIILAVGLYLYFNATEGNRFAEQIIAALSDFVSQERLSSLKFRFDNEKVLADKAREHILFGWGGWGRSLIFDESGKQLTITDSLWIIVFGVNGIAGLAALNTAILLPIFNFFWARYPARVWTKPEVSSAVALAIVIMLYMVDCLVNAMVNPLYVLACGGIAGLVLKPVKRSQTANAALEQRSFVQQ